MLKWSFFGGGSRPVVKQWGGSHGRSGGGIIRDRPDGVDGSSSDKRTRSLGTSALFFCWLLARGGDQTFVYGSSHLQRDIVAEDEVLESRKKGKRTGKMGEVRYSLHQTWVFPNRSH